MRAWDMAERNRKCLLQKDAVNLPSLTGRQHLADRCFQLASGSSTIWKFIRKFIFVPERATRAPVFCVLRRGKPWRLSPHPLPAGRFFRRYAPDSFSLDEAVASVATFRWCSDHPGMPFGFLPELAFSFAGIPNRSFGKRITEDPALLEPRRPWFITRSGPWGRRTAGYR